MRLVLTICCLITGYCLQAANSLLLQSPHKQLQTTVFLQNGQLLYRVTAGKTVLIEPSVLGIQLDVRMLGTTVNNLTIARQYVINERHPSRLNNSEAVNHCTVYVITVVGKNSTDTIEFRLFDNGCAFRYRPAGNDHRLMQEERTTFTLPAAATVWYFERNSDWKLKSYAGLWQHTTIEKLPTISSQGPIQGKPLVVELPSKKYIVLTEAALYDYSGMRLKAIGNNTLQVNFTEGKEGFAINGKLSTPWRVILYASNLQALVNNKVIENLNPAPDAGLFAQTDYIQPGKAVWSWITRNEHYMEPAEERKFIDAAAALQFQYTLIDEGWETKWPDKWQQLQELFAYAAQRNVKVWVWKHSKDIRDTVQRNNFLDSVRLAGAAGIKTDFMNSEAKDLVDFEIGLLQAAARRQLMVNFHGCQAPTGESKTYPNEMTREGIRGMELNIMKEPIPAWHNAALPFTRLLCGHGDYTPGFFSNKANTTYTHQLALLYLFNSPFQCIAENPVTLLNDPVYKPVLPLLKTLPVTWDETIVLPGSRIGELAAFARRAGKDWYIAVINGTDSTAAFTFQPSFLPKQKQHKAYIITDAPQDTGFVTREQNMDNKYSQRIAIPATGGMVIRIKSEQRSYTFTPSFVVLYNATDPGMALKPAGIKKVEYNVLTWKVQDSSRADFAQKKVSAAMAGDGFDDRILRSKAEWRTANIFNAGERTEIKATGARQKGDTVFFIFPESAVYKLSAYLLTTAKPYPLLQYSFRALQPGYYSIGYTGAPSCTIEKAAAIWQPLIWQEKRMPDAAYLTPAFMTTLPATMVYDGVNTIGVLAAPKEIPFQPLPMLPNSRFGVSLLNEHRQLQPQIYAPMPGGYLSQMKANDAFTFSFYLVTEPRTINDTYQKIAQQVFGFKDYRHNDIASLNTALDNMVDYSLSQYAWFVDSLKGCAYSTDVPGAVKNVSSLNPLELALVRDDSVMFEKRAYPLIEFMLSREKFLFSLDSTQKIQSPSRRLKGPIAPVSELAALYNVFDRKNDFYLQMAQQEYGKDRVRNMDGKERGNTWINAMYLYTATRDKKYLQEAVTKADQYLAQRIATPQTGFNDPMQTGYFFWPTFTGRWIEFLQLYELTNDKRYLEAARQGARQYTLFTWMCPLIPDSMITVNKGGKAPMYWYLKSKGHQQMYYPEEQAPAWRLSEIGLTPESSGTSTGHRGIFMANYAPWMLRIGYYTRDTFLMNVAKASIIGRYRNFPGYHINTERTTAYEKVDFPLHEHKEQSVNSFHYNHILPMASMLLDYLVTDAYVRSKGKISFPYEYMEGYAYLQNNLYGAQKGNFYTEKEVQLWMPARLLNINHTEINYIAARKDNKLLLAFTNQSGKAVTATVTINPAWVKLPGKSVVTAYTGKINKMMKDSSFTITVPANGIAAVMVQGAVIQSSFQQRILSPVPADTGREYATLSAGHAHAMLFRLGEYGRRLYVYLEDDDNKYRKAALIYQTPDGKEERIEDTAYPFEFTVPVDKRKGIPFYISLTSVHGEEVKSEEVFMGK